MIKPRELPDPEVDPWEMGRQILVTLGSLKPSLKTTTALAKLEEAMELVRQLAHGPEPIEPVQHGGRRSEPEPRSSGWQGTWTGSKVAAARPTLDELAEMPQDRRALQGSTCDLRLGRTRRTYRSAPYAARSELTGVPISTWAYLGVVMQLLCAQPASLFECGARWIAGGSQPHAPWERGLIQFRPHARTWSPGQFSCTPGVHQLHSTPHPQGCARVHPAGDPDHQVDRADHQRYR